MSDDAGTPKSSRSFSAIGLEQRMLLDAAAVSTAASVVAADDASLHAADGTSVDALGQVVNMAAQAGSARDAVFIDVSVANYQRLLQDISPDAEVFFIDPAKDGVQQMLDALSGSGQFRSIQIYSHGDVGELHVGTSVLSNASIASYTDSLASLGTHIEAGGDLLLFGCDIAGGQVGRDFVDRIAEMTGADVAASDGLTGSASASGNWALEYTRGDVTTQTVIDQRVQELFGATLTTGWTNFGSGTYRNSDNVAADEFGWSVAVADNTGWVVSGGYAQQDIYAYQPIGGGQYTEYKIVPPTTGAAGTSVDVDGNFLIIGYGSINRVYIYEFTGGAWVNRTGAGLVGTGTFGNDVAIQADGTVFRAVVGAPTYNAGAGVGQGGVYTYYSATGAAWTAGTILSTTDGRFDTELRFGTAVAIDGNDVIVGAPGWGYHSSSYGGGNDHHNLGKAYLFNWTTGVGVNIQDGAIDANWGQDGVSGTLDANPEWGNQGNDNAYMGSSVDISVNGTTQRAAFGAPSEGGNGEAYAVVNTTGVPGAWSGVTVMAPGMAGSQFGRSVAIDAYTGRVAVGAYAYATDDGRVLVYTNGGTGDSTFETGQADSRYGWSVALAKDLLITGAPWYDSDNSGVDKNGAFHAQIQNAAPVGVVNTVTITESATAVVDVRANDTDPNDANIDKGLLVYVTDPTVGSVSYAFGTITYDTTGDYEYLRAGVNATQVLTYTLQDGGGEQTTSTLTVTIQGQNDLPVIGTGISSQVGNAGQTITLFTAANPISSQTLQQLGAFVDPDVGDTFSYVFTNGLGTITVDATGFPGDATRQLTFTINATTGAVTFAPNAFRIGLSYTIPGIRVGDGTGTIDLAAFTVSVARTNVVPVATVGTLAMTAYEDNIKPGTYTQAGTLITVTSTGHGLTNGSSVSLDFVSGTSADSSYVISVVDANTFTVTDVASRTTSGNVFHTVPATQSVAAQFSDADSIQLPPEVLTYTLLAGSPSWVAVGSTTGALSLTGGNADVTGAPVAFTVRATDQYGLYADKAISMTLTPTNDAPSVTNTVDETQAYLGTTYVNGALTALVQLPVAYTGTYSQTGTATVTVTTAAVHNLAVGSTVSLDFTSGTAIDATYTVASIISTTQFTVTTPDVLTTSGNVTTVAGPTASPLFTDLDRMTPNTFTLSATFADGTPLNGTALIGGWLRFDGATGRFYTASAVTGSVGTVLSVRVSAVDNGTPSMTATYDFDISVFPAPNTSGGLLPSITPATNNQTGYAVSVSEDGLWMAVGEPGYDSTGNGNSRGQVRVYNWTGAAWAAVTTIAGPATDGARFGYSLDWNADATSLVVGAPGDNALAGRVYGYTRAAAVISAGTVASYVTTDANAGDNFGFSVALNRAGTQFVAGAPGDDAAGTEAGAVYIYTFNTAAQLAKRTSVVDAADAGVVWLDRFGTSVDFDGNVVVVGAPLDSSNGFYFNGSATVLGVNGTGFSGSVLKGTGAASYDMYGWDVALDIYKANAGAAADSSMVIAVGAPGSDLKTSSVTGAALLDSGAVYTYRSNAMTTAATQTDLNTVVQLAADTAYDGHAYDRFGISVDIDAQNTAANFGTDVADNGIRMVVGSNIDGSAQGSAYVYRDWSSLPGWTVSAWVGQKYLQNNTGITTSAAGNQYGWDATITNAPTSAWNVGYAVAAAGRVTVGAPSVDLVKTGTYSQAGTVVTVTSTGHGLAAGSVINLDFTSGASTDGTYIISSVVDANTFRVTDPNSRTTSGNISLTDGGTKGAVYSATTAGTDIETVPTPHSAVVDKWLSAPVALSAEVHLFDEEHDWTFAPVVVNPVARGGLEDGIGSVAESMKTADQDIDPLLFLLQLGLNAADTDATEGGDGQPAATDGADKPAAKPVPQADKAPASAALSHQLQQVGTRHQQQAQDLLDRLLHA